MSAESYLEKAMPIIEECFGSFKNLISKSRLKNPAALEYHPEINETPMLVDDGTHLYQSCIGIM